MAPYCVRGGERLWQNAKLQLADELQLANAPRRAARLPVQPSVEIRVEPEREDLVEKKLSFGFE